jgi:Ser/Thr protein kinase RdoA (MazF antagonist)
MTTVDGDDGPTRMLGPRIAHGRQAEFYARRDGDAVVKLYRAGVGGYESEAAALTCLDGTGIAPRLLDTVVVDRRVGLVMQRLDGLDMLTLLQRQPWRMASLARMLAHSALRIHAVPAPADLPNLNDVMRRQIVAADLDPRRRDFALSTLDPLPAGDRLCHGDFHPGNAVVTANGTSIIDWPAATRGVPEADFARTLLLLRQADPLPGTPLAFRMLLAAGRTMFASVFAHAYRNAAPQLLANTAAWTVVHAAARLAEGITVERARLIRILDAADGRR